MDAKESKRLKGLSNKQLIDEFIEEVAESSHYIRELGAAAYRTTAMDGIKKRDAMKVELLLRLNKKSNQVAITKQQR